MAKRKAAAPNQDAAVGGADQEAADNNVYIGKSVRPEYILLRLANRHGLITGATGTGKTVTLQGLAEGFSDHGVPVFCADVKGDLSGIAETGEPKPWIVERDEAIGFKQEFRAYPVIFWDLFGKQGLPIRTTVTDMGPLLLSRLMDLSDAQEGVLNIAFKIAGEEDLPLITLKNLQTLLEGLAARADTLTTKYGNITKATVGSIQRSLLVLEQQGGEHFFGKPVLDIEDIMQTKGRQGYISVLAADRLMNSPRLYATFLLFLLSDLFEKLPEVGDPEKPKLVFFFDEAHLLFKDAPKALLEKVEQVVRLIRSKGVGVYFVTQNPLDIPDTVSRQLGNRVQHALRAFTPMEQKAVKAAATTFRPNPAFDTEKAIMELGTGEALVSTLDQKGAADDCRAHAGASAEIARRADHQRRARGGDRGKPRRGQISEKPRDSEADQERLQEWADKPAEAKAEAKAAKANKTDDDDDASPRSSGGSRSDSFWTTVGKTIIRTGVPLATKMLTDALKGRTRR